MSFSELSIVITAQNLASSEFARVSTDAGSMASQITGTSNSVSLLGAEFAETGTQASNMAESAEQSAVALTEVGTKAEETNIKLTTVARGLSSVTSFGSACMVLAGDMGIVDKSTAKWVSTILAVITVVSTFTRLQAYSTLLTQGHTASVTLDTMAQEANASSSIASSVAHRIYASACSIATAAENALNISHATFLALTGIGIGVIIAAAAAMAYFASQMNTATSSVQNFNSAASETPTRTRSIQRAGEAVPSVSRNRAYDSEAPLYRRGVE